MCQNPADKRELLSRHITLSLCLQLDQISLHSLILTKSELSSRHRKTESLLEAVQRYQVKLQAKTQSSTSRGQTESVRIKLCEDIRSSSSQSGLPSSVKGELHSDENKYENKV